MKSEWPIVVWSFDTGLLGGEGRSDFLCTPSYGQRP
jgi:hypothetical protein